MKLSRIILLFLVFPAALTLVGQDTVKTRWPEARFLEGYVWDQVNKKAVPYTHIINRNRASGTISDTSGMFAIRANIGDTLFVSAMGYQFEVIKIVDEMLEGPEGAVINMLPRAYMLPEVVIYELNTYEKFRDKFFELTVEHERYTVPGIPLIERRRIPALMDTNYIRNPMFAITSPISFLYYNISRREKNKRLYMELMQKEQLRTLAARRFNKTMLTRITGLEGAQLDEFIEFSDIDPYFILRTNDYELYILTLRRLDDFNRMKMQE